MGAELFWRFTVYVVITALLSYATYLFFGNIVQAETAKPLMRVEAHDLLDPAAGTHRLSGMVMVPTPCHSIKVKTQELEPGKFHVYFSTFGDEHGCEADPQPRTFRQTVKAPLIGTEFSASIDWKPLDFIIISQATIRT